MESQPSRRFSWRSVSVFAPLAFLVCAGGAFGIFRVATKPVVQAASAPAESPVPASVSSSAPTVPTTPIVIEAPAVSHVPLPTEVRGFYWTGYTAGSKRVDELLAYASSSHLNSVVIDLKLDNGDLAFVPKSPDLQTMVPKSPAIRDLDGLMAKLKDQGIYRIARVFIMRDGAFGRLHPETVLRTVAGAVWHDKTGTPWLDPAAPEVADYAVTLAREAYARGFDELQFDYVRFPSDGVLSAIRYPVYDGKTPKAEIMQKLFATVGGSLQADHIPVSFDLFGMTFWSTDDFNIGQRLGDAYPFANQISPMVYPSHYPNGFEGFANPAEHPYEIVKRSLDKGISTLRKTEPEAATSTAQEKFRPWIQDFDIGAQYDAAKVSAQIKAARDAGASGWLIWNARNVYTPVNYLK